MLSYMRSTWNSLRSFIPGLERRCKGRIGPSNRPSYEHLETRCVLSCSLVTLNSANGYLTVLGTANSDNVTVSESQGLVTASLAPSTHCTFPTSQILKLQFFGDQGDDQYDNRTAIDSFVYGGGGNDTLIGGSGSDWMEGQDGTDIVRGNGGNEVVKGGGWERPTVWR